MANEVIGGSFTARLNMNLREDKHWSYGARSMLADAEGQRPWLAYAPVQIDKTAESLAEMQREISSYVDGERSEEHTSELQSLMRISYAVFCLKKKNNHNHNTEIPPSYRRKTTYTTQNQQ